MFNSIRIRLTIWYLGVLALIIIAFAASVYLLVERNLNRTTDENLAERARNVETDLRKEETDIAEERRLREAEKTKNLKPEEPDEDEDEQATDE
jgi:predicted Holliday junction resolvase-like endonuclease